MTCPANPDIIQVPWEFIEGDEAPKVQRFGSDDGANATFRIKGEDHTLGNALKWMLQTSDERHVEFAAYTIPHPHSDAMNIRVQTKQGQNAEEVLIGASRKLQDLCNTINDKYNKALDKYNKSNKKSKKKKKKSKKDKIKIKVEEKMDDDDDSD